MHGRKTTEPMADHRGRGLSAHTDGEPILSARIATATPEESSPRRSAPTHPFTTQARRPIRTRVEMLPTLTRHRVGHLLFEHFHTTLRAHMYTLE